MEFEKNGSVTIREICGNGSCMKVTELEAKLDAGNVEEAEATLRNGLSISSEVHFCLLIVYSILHDNTNQCYNVTLLSNGLSIIDLLPQCYHFE